MAHGGPGGPESGAAEPLRAIHRPFSVPDALAGSGMKFMVCIQSRPVSVRNDFAVFPCLTQLWEGDQLVIWLTAVLILLVSRSNICLPYVGIPWAQATVSEAWLLDVFSDNFENVGVMSACLAYDLSDSLL